MDGWTDGRTDEWTDGWTLESATPAARSAMRSRTLPADLDPGDVERDQLHLADVARDPQLRRLGRDDPQVQ